MGNEERWVKHYSSNQRILLVGDGDFSFSLSLALQFGSATNIVATSLDTYDILVGKYKNAKWNLQKLVTLGACTLHGVDATKMSRHHGLNMQKFDRIIFNFPHAGFHGKEGHIRQIERNKKLVLGFFKNASGMLRANGEIHVTHKTTHPYSRWNIEELASRNSLGLIERVEFKIRDYLCYSHKRGDSNRCDGSFRLGECCTYKFRLFPPVKKMTDVPLRWDNNPIRYELPYTFAIETKDQLTTFNRGNPHLHLSKNMDDVRQKPLSIGNGYYFVRDLNRASEIYQTHTMSDWYNSDRERLRLRGYKRSSVEAFGNDQEQYRRNLVQTYG